MNIKKFEVNYGGYFSESHQVIFQNGDLYYYKDRLLRELSPLKIDVTGEKLEKFMTELKPMTQSWIKYYSMPVCDGIQWELIIQSESEKITYSGSNGFPHNFHIFLKLFRRFIGYPGFARGYHPDPMFTWGEPLPPGSDLINLYNRRTTMHLRKQKRTIPQLARFLEFETAYVRNQLQCNETFDIKILIRIATFLEVSLTEFLYESDHDLAKEKVVIGIDSIRTASTSNTRNLSLIVTTGATIKK